jgi:hypothetical protein
LKFDPFDRLQETAVRIFTEQPAPPRTVSMVALFRAAATPVFAIAAVPLLAVMLFVGPFARLDILFILVLAALWAGFLSFLRAFRIRSPLVHGVMVEAEVLTVETASRGSLRGRLRVDHLGRRFETDFTWGRPGNVRPGDRIQAVIAADQDRVLWCLGLSPGLA